MGGTHVEGLGGPRGSEKEERGVQVVKKVGFGAGQQGGAGFKSQPLQSIT